MENHSKFIVALVTAFWGWVYPSLGYIIIAVLLIILDNISAYKCNKRVKKKYPDKCKSDKYSSYKAWKTLNTIGTALLFILSAWAVEKHIVSAFSDFKLTAIVACIICGVTVLSILENWSTANDNAPRWLNIIKKFLVDKTERYLNTDINDDGEIGN